MGTSPRPMGGCSAVRYLFREQLRARGGGVGFLPLGSYCCEVGQVLGIKRPMVIICLVTISSLGSDFAPEELTDSAVAWLDYLNGGFGFNRHVDPMTLGPKFSRGVPYWCEFV